MTEDKSGITEKLKRQILRSGFPLEVKVAANIEKGLDDFDAEISTSTYYLDKDEGKGREIDIKIIVPISGNQNGPMIFLNLIIECKNVPGNSWVFFETSQHICFTYQSISIFKATKWQSNLESDWVQNVNLHFRDAITTNMDDEYISDRKLLNGKNNNLFEARTTLAKAVDFEVEEEKKNFLDLTEADPNGLSYVNIYYPIIVFNGNMFQVDNVTEGLEMTLNPIQHICRHVDYISGSYKIESLMDIVTADYLYPYINILRQDIIALKEACNSELAKKFHEEVPKAVD